MARNVANKKINEKQNKKKEYEEKYFEQNRPSTKQGKIR